MTEEQARAIAVGTSVVYTTAPARLGAHQFCGKALDDRGCFAILLRTLQLLQTPLPFDLYVLGSVQEESTMAVSYTHLDVYKRQSGCSRKQRDRH